MSACTLSSPLSEEASLRRATPVGSEAGHAHAPTRPGPGVPTHAGPHVPFPENKAFPNTFPPDVVGEVRGARPDHLQNLLGLFADRQSEKGSSRKTRGGGRGDRTAVLWPVSVAGQPSAFTPCRRPDRTGRRAAGPCRASLRLPPAHAPHPHGSPASFPALSLTSIPPSPVTESPRVCDTHRHVHTDRH